LRFGVYPLFVIVLWLLVQAKYARGYRRATLEVSQVGVSNVEAGEARKI
ncbi:hypothetical protein LCGC14_2218360, partial [marine sediment metagenome]